MKSLWKQKESLHPVFQLIQGCLAEDWFLLPYEIELQRAHSKALANAEILTEKEHKGILDALDAIASDYRDAPVPESECEDIHTWIEAELTNRTGEAGKKIHTARSRNDQVATLLKLYLLDSVSGLEEKLGNLVGCLCKKAEAWSDLEFPLQTHTQFAAPGTVGFWALRYGTAFRRVQEQLQWHHAQWKQTCPLGSGAVAGSSIPIDRQVQAEGLGFQAPSLNALDSTGSRDECLQLLAVSVQLGLHLQSLATDGIAFAQTPFGWARYPSSFATGSSMMPNKSNPDALELLRGECNQVHAAHTHAVHLLKGLPSGYNRDLQCLKPVVHSTVEKLLLLLDMTHDFVADLAFEEENLTRSLGQGGIQATLRMEQQVQKGASLRDAHHFQAKHGARDSNSPEEQRLGAQHYKTLGSSHPEEVKRVAAELSAEIGGEGP